MPEELPGLLRGGVSWGLGTLFAGRGDNCRWEFSERMDKGLWKEKEELIDEGDGDHEGMQYTR